MSVINKMLRDLDHRANPLAAVQPGPAALRHGTASVSINPLASPQPQAAFGPRRWLWLGLLTLAAAAVGGWMWWESASTAPAASGTVNPVALAAVAPGAAASTTSEAISTSAAAPQPAAISSADAASEPSIASVILRMEPSLSARKALDALLSTPVPVAGNARPAFAPPAAATAVASPPAPATPATPQLAASRATGPKVITTATAPISPGDSAPVLQRQQQASGDALMQAQGLWTSGSRDAAIDLMQQSIAAAERSAKTSAPGTASIAVLVPLVREMARMQLAEARFGAVWEMLTRLEPLLGNTPDLWAIRANAAQRLGRHQDSVHAYMMALQSRPDEQRWLLGTAVSLAALGQTSSAAEMADKARAVGPVSKDILAYLRQTGVVLREQ